MMKRKAGITTCREEINLDEKVKKKFFLLRMRCINIQGSNNYNIFQVRFNFDMFVQELYPTLPFQFENKWLMLSDKNLAVKIKQ